jgi:hypothetical protein
MPWRLRDEGGAAHHQGIVFEYSGVSAAVYEEFVWRVKMIRAEAGAVADV